MRNEYENRGFVKLLFSFKGELSRGDFLGACLIGGIFMWLVSHGIDMGMSNYYNSTPQGRQVEQFMIGLSQKARENGGHYSMPTQEAEANSGYINMMNQMRTVYFLKIMATVYIFSAICAKRVRNMGAGIIGVFISTSILLALHLMEYNVTMKMFASNANGWAIIQGINTYGIGYFFYYLLLLILPSRKG